MNLVLVTSELLGTTDPGCNRIGYVMFEKFVLQEIVILLRFLHHFCVYVLLFFYRKVQVIRFYLLLWR